jgi:hypothetical protein
LHEHSAYRCGTQCFHLGSENLAVRSVSQQAAWSTIMLATVLGAVLPCDGRGPYPPTAAYVISTARTVSNPARAQDIRRQWKRRFLSLAGCVRRPPAPKCFMLAFGNRLTTATRSAIGRIEFAFPAFANVPYQDAQTRLELMQLLEDLMVDYSEGWQP